MSEKTATQKFLELKSEIKPEYVGVKAPSGFTYKFQKPSKFALLFGARDLPLGVANEAAKEWQAQGVGAVADSEAAGFSDEQIQALTDKSFQMADRVLEMSYSPKLVYGATNAEKDELCINELPEADQEYLFAWVAAGGDASAMLAMFPQGQQNGVLARSTRKKQRHPRV